MSYLRRWLPTREKLEQNRWLRWLSPFFAHPRLWHWSRRGVSLGVALGIFFGLLIPIAQIPLSAAAAVVMRANLPAAVASTLVTNPVTFAPIYYAAYRLGLWVSGEAGEAELTEAALIAEAESHAPDSLWSRLTSMGRPLLIGLAILASFSGLVTYLAITLLWRWRVLAKRRARSRV